MITIHASARYMQTGHYIARIVGRDPKFTFAREFIGRKGGKRNESCSADVDDVGLYESRDVDSKGRKDDTYHLLLVDRTSGELVEKRIPKEDAMKIAKLMAKRDIEEIVKICRRTDGTTGWCYISEGKS